MDLVAAQREVAGLEVTLSADGQRLSIIDSVIRHASIRGRMAPLPAKNVTKLYRCPCVAYGSWLSGSSGGSLRDRGRTTDIFHCVVSTIGQKNDLYVGAIHGMR